MRILAAVYVLQQKNLYLPKHHDVSEFKSGMGQLKLGLKKLSESDMLYAGILAEASGHRIH